DDRLAEGERVGLQLRLVLMPAPCVRVRVVADRRREHAPGRDRRNEEQPERRQCDRGPDRSPSAHYLTGGSSRSGTTLCFENRIGSLRARMSGAEDGMVTSNLALYMRSSKVAPVLALATAKIGNA